MQTERPLADERTLIALDFASVRDRVVAATRTQRGRAKALLLHPVADFPLVHLEQARTAVIRELTASADLRVAPAIETAEATHAAQLGRTLAPSDLRSVGDAIAAAAAAYDAVHGTRSPALAAILARYAPLRDLHRELTNAIDERGAVPDRASPALARIRRSLSQAQHDARDRVASILRSERYAKAIQDAVVTIREGRFVAPVKSEFAGEFPGIVHDTSSSGQTLFIEPLAALDANNRIRTLRLEEEREVLRILEALSRSVGAHAPQIDANIEMLAEIDVLLAKAHLAKAMDAIAPELSEDPILSVERGRHPLLGDRAIPQTLSLDRTTRLVVISGPNMGGKTVALKTVGLFVVMAYAGLQLPAAFGTRIGRFTHAIADIGDEQSIVGNTSTFSAHLQRMWEMLESADEHTLILVDEIGGGTEPSAGAALAIAMLERLLRAGSCGVATTHATELKLFASSTPGVANASVRFDPATFRPTFHLDVGVPGQSLAFPLATALGLDPDMVERAQTLLDSRERDYESALAELSQRSMELQTHRDELARERMQVAGQQSELTAERERFNAERRSFADRAEERMASALRDFIAQLQRRASEAQSKRPKVTVAQSDLLTATAGRMRNDLGIRAQQRPAEQGAAFAVGDAVHIESLGQDGTIAEDYGESVLIAIGAMKTVVKKADLRRRPQPQMKKSHTGSGAARIEAASRSSAELDVRGKRFVEAEPIVEKWIDQAMLAGNTSLRLIHGKGTGLLGRGLQEYLRTNPAVKSIRYGNEDEGSGGVTVIELGSH